MNNHSLVSPAPVIRKHNAFLQLSKRSLKWFPNLDVNHIMRTEGTLTYLEDSLYKVTLVSVNPKTDELETVSATGRFAIETLGVEVLAVDIDPLEGPAWPSRDADDWPDEAFTEPDGITADPHQEHDHRFQSGHNQ